MKYIVWILLFLIVRSFIIAANIESTWAFTLGCAMTGLYWSILAINKEE